MKFTELSNRQTCLRNKDGGKIFIEKNNEVYKWCGNCREYHPATVEVFGMRNGGLQSYCRHSKTVEPVYGVTPYPGPASSYPRILTGIFGTP